MDRKPLNSWVHPKERPALLGDSCRSVLVCRPLHDSQLSWPYLSPPVQPYRALGAMAIEDAAVLGACSGTLHQSRKFPPFCVHTKIFGLYCNPPFVPRAQFASTLIIN